MKLAKLLKGLKYEIIQGTEEQEIAAIVDHSKEATSNSLFVCITGMCVDGCTYIDEAIQRGTVAIIVEKEIQNLKDITVIRVKDSRIALSKIAINFYGNPAKDLTVIGVTGTKGKTTVTCMIQEILKKAGYRAGLIGTIEIRTGKRTMPSNQTSPESIRIQKYMREMVESGCKYVVMEVSSQALKMHRVDGILFDIAVFTNLGEDHIGTYEHRDWNEYRSCKARLFQQCKIGILNRDDENWTKMIEDTDCKIETFGFDRKSKYCISDEKVLGNKERMGETYRLNGHRIELEMPGTFNVYNATAAYVVCQTLHVSNQMIEETLKHVHVRGRVEPIDIAPLHGFHVLVDYAHNAMSLQNVLKMIKFYNPKRLITIFGCGGGRSKIRRFEMGKVAGQFSDYTIITSDNPRYENPKEIMQDICAGIKETQGKYLKIIDRKDAVEYAILTAQEEDVILIAGKGHEAYQEIAGIRYPMDDRILIREAIKKRQRIAKE